MSRFLGWTFACLVVWAAMASLGITCLYLALKDSIPALPSVQQYIPPSTTRIFSQNGVLIGEFAIERRDVVEASKIPQRLVRAFIASEDDNFFNHGGIDPLGILRAAWKNLKAGRVVQGGSTITQQVAKSIIGREKTFTRKFKEAILARRLETKLGKEEILFLYLNQIYLGHGSYGVQAAARNYFHKNVWELSLPEMTTIAGLPQAPSDYDPVDRPKAAEERRHYVLDRLQEVQAITPEEAQQARATPIVAYPIVDIFRQRAPYYTEEVRRQIQQEYGTEALYEGGLRVDTGVDIDWQAAAEEILLPNLRMVDRRQGYRGPLYKFEKSTERDAFLAKVQARLTPEKIASGDPVPAVVDKVGEYFAELRIGEQRGILPVMGMRWAHPVDPTIYFASSVNRVGDVRKVLHPNDLILVRKVELDKLMENEIPAMRKQLPDGSAVFALEQIPAMQGALVSMEPELGYVRALLGGYNFADSEFNRILQACRQPGSAFKPLHYGLAIESRNYNPATVLIDSAVVYDDPENQNRWKPENFDSDFKGKVTVYTALVNSMNVPAIKVLEDIGLTDALAWDRKLGISTPLKAELGLALGSACVKPWDLANAYAIFQAGGRKPEMSFLRKVTDRYGRVLKNHTSFKDPYQSWDERFDRAYDRLVTTRERMLSPDSNYVLLSLMKAVCSVGTGAEARSLGKPVAGKTGTTNQSADAWFVGFTKDILTLIWLGHDEPREPLNIGETGGRTALPIWVKYMQRILAQRPQADFEVPDGITFARFDPTSGLLARPDTANAVLGAFKVGEIPKEVVPARDMAKPNEFFKVDRNY